MVLALDWLTILGREQVGSLADRLDQGLAWVVDHLILQVLFFDAHTGIPLIVLWLIAGAVFFTLRMGLINVRGFTHAIAVLRGSYDHNDDAGEVSHLQALATALSATVGLGNVAGVAIAIDLGGPGAVFWMTVAGALGMTSKFVECTLAQKYRILRPDGTVVGGPMYYLSAGLAAIGQQRLGQVLARLFAFFCICGALGGTCLFQPNQSYQAIAAAVPWLAGRDWLYGLVFTVLVGLVVIGGIQRISRWATAIVPSMCALYVGASLWILAIHVTEIPAALSTIVQEAFSPSAVDGGVIGVLVQGLRRSAFSNEAGIGSAAIAHATARTKEPIRAGIVASLEPFIDTVILCNMTALVVIITGVYQQPEWADLGGAELTIAAFGSVADWLPAVLAIALFFFAFSTVISWGYYGEQGWDYLFGEWGQPSRLLYKGLLLFAVFLGTVANPLAVVNFGDGMLLAMAFPNLLGLYFLSNQVAADLKDYRTRLSTMSPR